MRQLTTQAWADLRRLLSEEAIVWCVAIEVANGAAHYLTTHRRPLTYAGRTWQPWPMQIGLMTADGEGDLARTDLTVANIGREIVRYLEAFGWEDGDVRLRLVNVSSPDAVDYGFEIRYSILGAAATRKAATLSLGQDNFYSRQFPHRRFIRDEGFPGIQRNAS